MKCWSHIVEIASDKVVIHKSLNLYACLHKQGEMKTVVHLTVIIYMNTQI